jgi:hypothetical protein
VLRDRRQAKGMPSFAVVQISLRHEATRRCEAAGRRVTATSLTTQCDEVEMGQGFLLAPSRPFPVPGQSIANVGARPAPGSINVGLGCDAHPARD